MTSIVEVDRSAESISCEARPPQLCPSKVSTATIPEPRSALRGGTDALPSRNPADLPAFIGPKIPRKWLAPASLLKCFECTALA
jgi:hypothetical protein